MANSIDVQGLLQPIVVCAAETEGKWEILTGQRRFLAHELLKRETISAAVLDRRVDESQAKAISITENLMRRRLSGKELKEGILFLHNIYGSVKDVVTATGLTRAQVQGYVKYPRLLPELKELVDQEVVDVNAALRAQDASEDDYGEPDPSVAVRLAQEMGPMSNLQRDNVIRDRKQNPDKPIDEVVEDAKRGARVVQVVAAVSRETHRAIRKVASEERVNQNEAVAGLIEEALMERGLLE